MCFSFREVPNITLIEYFILVAAFLVYSRNSDLTMVYISPFGLA